MDVIDQIFTNFGVTWPKFIAQVVLFLVVYLVLNRYAFGPIIKVLEERRRLIAEGQMNAEKIKQQLAEADQRYEEVLKKAHAEAAALIEETRRTAEALTQREAQNAILQAEEIIAKARTDIGLERNRMVAEVKKEMVDLVVDTTAKVTGKVLTSEDQKRLNEETVAQLAV